MSTYDKKYVRNFYIIARIDHDKSTFADRIIEKMGLLTERKMQGQILDTMEFERERDTTIKNQTIRTVYRVADGEEYIFGLTGTPGHADFNYKVSYALTARDGAVLMVDVSQDIEAQTFVNVYVTLDHDLEVTPIISKMGLSSVEPDKVAAEIEDIIGIEAESTPRISAKTGLNVDQVLEAIMKRPPPPGDDEKAPLQALIFDSLHDSHRGTIVFLCVKNDTVRKGDRVRTTATGAEMDVAGAGHFVPGRFIPCDELSAGTVGCLTASIKNVWNTRVGGTATHAKSPAAKALPDYKRVTLTVYCGFYPAGAAQYWDPCDMLEKLQLNSASLTCESGTSLALGFDFRCGFLGLLHPEIIQRRLEREYDLDLVTTAPGVVYRVYKTDGAMLELMNPLNLPDATKIEHMEEPVVSVKIILIREFIGSVIQLCQGRYGLYLGTDYMERDHTILKHELLLNKVIYNFFDALESRSRGYVSLDYGLKGCRPSKLVELDILTNREATDVLSFIVFADGAYERGRKMCGKLTKKIPRQLFDIPIQATAGSKIIVCEVVKAMRKSVLAKCYDSNISRKKELLEKQEEGKKRVYQIGSVRVPQKVFMSVLRLSDE